MIGTSWKSHVTRLLAIGALVTIVGWMTGQLTATLLLALGAYAAWQLGNMVRLYGWLHDDQPNPPESLGIWSEIFERIHRLQKRNREQHEQFPAIPDADRLFGPNRHGTSSRDFIR